MGSSTSKCDVFLSFKDDDICDNFTSDLCKALRKKKIYAYMDDKSKKEDNEISPTLTEEIKKAKLSIIVFSNNFASSTSCLDELVQIAECKEKKGQIIVPVFYDVDPLDVRKQKGHFALKFQGLRKYKVQTWREALYKTSNLSGWASRYNTGDLNMPKLKFIKAIVEDVSQRLKRLQEMSNVVPTTTGLMAWSVTTES